MIGKDVEDEIVRLHEAGTSISAIAATMGVSRSTVYRVLGQRSPTPPPPAVPAAGLHEVRRRAHLQTLLEQAITGLQGEQAGARRRTVYPVLAAEAQSLLAALPGAPLAEAEEEVADFMRHVEAIGADEGAVTSVAAVCRDAKAMRELEASTGIKLGVLQAWTSMDADLLQDIRRLRMTADELDAMVVEAEDELVLLEDEVRRLRHERDQRAPGGR